MTPADPFLSLQERGSGDGGEEEDCLKGKGLQWYSLLIDSQGEHSQLAD